MHALETDASIDAIRHTAAGDVLWGSAILRAPVSLWFRGAIPSPAGTPASLLSRLTRRRPSRRCSTRRFGLLSLMAKAALTSSITSTLLPKLARLFLLVFAFLDLSCLWTVICLCPMEALTGYGPSWVEASHVCMCMHHSCRFPCSI